MDSTSADAFLRLALREGNGAEPYRGPATFTRDALTYTNASSGSLAAFWGLETISSRGESVYELRYAGGFLG